MKPLTTPELRSTIKSMNLTGLVSLSFNRDNEDDKNYIVVVGDQQLRFETTKEQNKVFSLLTTKFGFEKYSNTVSHVSEEERGYLEGWAADMSNPKQHGRTVAVSITSSGNGSHLVWDYYKQKIVEKHELTLV